MLFPSPRPKTSTSEILTGSTGSWDGSAQSLNAGKLQYHFPPSFRLGGAMLLHLTGAAAVFMTRIIGSTKTSELLNVTGISFVHSVCWRGTTLTAWHLVTYTVAPFLVIWCPLPNTCIRLYGFSAPAKLSILTWTICLRLLQISAFTCCIRSFKDMVAITCKKLTSDSRRVTSASPVSVLNLPDATYIQDMEWRKTMMFLMWVLMAALLQSRKDSVSSNPATWSLSLPSTMASPPAYLSLKVSWCFPGTAGRCCPGSPLASTPTRRCHPVCPSLDWHP